MQKVTSEEFEQNLKKKRKTKFIEELDSMKIGEVCFLFQYDKYFTSYIYAYIGNILKKSGKKFKTTTAHDNSGWYIKRIK
jgi:hypothetical protein